MAVNKIRCIDQTIYILGTNHLAHSSREMVERTISEIHPDIVMVELDEDRLTLIQKNRQTIRSDSKVIKRTVNINQNSTIKKGVQIESVNAKLIKNKKKEKKVESQKDQEKGSKKESKKELGKKFEIGLGNELDKETKMELDKELEQNSRNKKKLNLISKNLENDAFFTTLEQIQQQFGQIMQIMPGEEILTAIDIVQSNQIPVKLIDLPISELMLKISELGNQLTNKSESSVLIHALEEEEMPTTRSELEELFALLEDEEGMRQLLAEFEKEFPQLTQILITDRNSYMVAQIGQYHKKFPDNRILVICGAFHVPGIIELLSDLQNVNPKENQNI
ncbi:MAG: TraB domain-containing protein [Candidatus Lokiarchaeota archaeon]|nr:TraB domain-containing protein [Candidatus Harpocratesius repetitus]